MKNIIIVLAFVLGAFSAQAQIQIGAGFGYGTEVEELGLNIRAGYGLTENWRIAADYITYFIEGDGVSVNEINLNANYSFGTETLRPYVLAGLNYATVKASFLGFSSSNSEIGLNVGGGLNYMLSDNFGLVGEARYIIGDYDQLVIVGGVFFQL